MGVRPAFTATSSIEGRSRRRLDTKSIARLTTA
jgi:hypothetical protein